MGRIRGRGDVLNNVRQVEMTVAVARVTNVRIRDDELLKS